MKITRLSPPIRSLFAAVLLGPLVGGHAADLASGQTEHSAPAQQQQPAPAEQTFSLDFPGGSVAELLQAIEKATGKVPNVIVSKEAATLSVPPFKVGGITLDGLAQALSAVGAGNWMHPTPSSWAVQPVMVRLGPAPQRQQVSVDNIGPLLKSHNVTDIVAAIQLCLQLAPSSDESKAEIRYHKETSLLLVRGTGEQINIAKSVLHALELQMSTHPSENAAPGAPPPPVGQKP